jgi:hypothetical protein
VYELRSTFTTEIQAPAQYPLLTQDDNAIKIGGLHQTCFHHVILLTTHAMRVQLSALWALSFFYTLTLSQSLPYNPTSIFLSSDEDTAYVFVQSSSSAQYQLGSLNISTTLSTSNLAIDTLWPNLPFAENSSAFIPSLSSTGEINVYTGSCTTSTSSELWTFTPPDANTVGNGTWTQETTTSSTDLPGAYFLSTGFSFSSLVNANSSDVEIYVFGGMCPETNSTPSTWQSDASYSNKMLQLSPTSATYDLDVTASDGPPIAEAGFTITGLTPTYSNLSGVMTQQRDYALLGGHTQTAFINMSQIAVWSLPQESWSFVAIDGPVSAPSTTELTLKRTASTVDSRSGHTAVLTEDGESIIVFGGWVGDIGQAADPQLAVLSLGTGFGGSGDWVWSIPAAQPTGTGIYGHGAVLLPGNIMMVLGGYNISSSASSKRDISSGTQTMFLNATSMTWMSDYTNPASIVAPLVTSPSSGNSMALKVGLGAGLGLGLAALVGAIAVYFWYSSRLRRKREEQELEREKSFNVLSGGMAEYYSSDRRSSQTGMGFPWTQGRWNNNSENPAGPFHDSNSATEEYENLHEGVGDDGGAPPPPRHIQRKPLHSRNARGLYQPTPTFEVNNPANPRANNLGTAGPIHPIYEADEDAQAPPPVDTTVGLALGDLSGNGSSNLNRYSDPFKDPPVPTASASSGRRDNRSFMANETESPAQSREREIQEWVSDWAAADVLLSSQAKSHSQAGRLSPTRRAQLIASNAGSVSGEDDSGRTASNLSERSIAISAMSGSHSGSSSQGRSRSNSLRGFITNAMNPFTSTVQSTTVGSTNLSPVFDRPGSRNKPSSSSGSSSFTTANTTFPMLQAEGESLLPPPGSSSDHSLARSQTNYVGSPSKSKAPAFSNPRAQMGWLGSLRRVFVGGDSSNLQPDLGYTPRYRSREPSPTRVAFVDGNEPRRSASAGAILWRRKQGKGDWNDSADYQSQQSGRSNTFTGEMPRSAGVGPPSSVGDDEDWDIERAVENRVVQVMFTVPKEKLRVVNHNVDDDISDKDSMKSIGGSKSSEKSFKILREERVIRQEVSNLDLGPRRQKSRVLEMVGKMEERSKTLSPDR